MTTGSNDNPYNGRWSWLVFNTKYTTTYPGYHPQQILVKEAEEELESDADHEEQPGADGREAAQEHEVEHAVAGLVVQDDERREHQEVEQHVVHPHPEATVHSESLPRVPHRPRLKMIKRIKNRIVYG